MGFKRQLNWRQCLRLTAALAIVLASIPPLPARAAVPAIFNYQGKLANVSGTPTNTPTPMSFRIYDDLNTLLTTYTPSANVPVTNGVFNVLIGDVVGGSVVGSSLDLALSGSGDRYLEVVVNGVAMSPRQRLVAVPYALSVADGSVGTTQLAAGAVTDVKVTSVGWNKLAGVPAGFADGVDDGGVTVNGSGPVTAVNFNAPLTRSVVGPTATIGVDASSVTLMGNTFNTGGNLARLSGGVLPFSLMGATDTFRTNLEAAWRGVQIVPVANAGLAGGGPLTGNVSIGLDTTGLLTGCNTDPGSGKVYWDGGKLVCGDDDGGSGGTVSGPATPVLNGLAKWTSGSSQVLGNSSITDNGTVVGVGAPLNVTGTVSATGFSGNGSGLSNVDAVTLGGQVAGNFAAAAHVHNAGDITSGLLGVARGGTGAGSYTANQFLIYNGTTLASSGFGSSSFAGASHSHDVTTAEITGILPVGKGGTGQGTLTANSVLLGNGAGAIATSGAMGTGQVLAGRTGQAPIAKDLLGTANQVVVTNNAGNVTLSLPQSVGTASDVTFNDVTATGNVSGTWTGSSIDVTSGGTGRGSLLSRGVVIGAGTQPVNVSSGAVNQVLIAGGGADPAFGLITNNNLQAGTFGNIGGVGTLTSGTWQGTAVGTQYGGTGQNWSAVTAGRMPYFSGTGVMGTVPVGANGQVLTLTGGLPTWAAPPMGGGGTVTQVDMGLGLVAGSITTSGQIDLNVNTALGCGAATKVYWTGSNLVCAPDAGGTGTVGGTGTIDQFAVWTSATNIGPSPLLSRLSATDLQVGGNLTVTGSTGLNVTAGRITGTVGTGNPGAGGGATWEGNTVAVNRGGTGAVTLTSGGVLLGNGTGSVTATGVLTNGQLLIGDGSGAPTVGALTGTTDQVNVTNGAGTITLGLPQDINTTSSPTFNNLTVTGLAVNGTESFGGSGRLTLPGAVTSAGQVGYAGGVLQYRDGAGTQTVVNTTRAVNTTANGGLLGGGNLSTDRSLSLDLNTSAGCGSGAAGKVYWSGTQLVCSPTALGGTLSVGGGGTGITTPTSWGVMYYNPTLTTMGTVAGGAGQLLMGNGAAAPSWVTPASANTASAIVQRDASGNFSAGTITAALSGNATTATTATNLAGGSNGTIPYQTGAGATTMLAVGTAGQVLQTNGAAAPTWVNATNLNTANAIVKRDASGNFSAGTITASLSGNATTATTATTAGSVTGIVAVANGGTGQTSLAAAGIPTGTGTAGQVAYWTGTNTLSANGSNLAWDNTNARLGVGAAAPNARLTVGPVLGGSALGTTFTTNGGVLPMAAGGFLSLANIGFTSNNNTSLGIKARRTAAGTDWNTTAIVLSYDVDNNSPANGGATGQMWMLANGNFGFGTSTPISTVQVGGAVTSDFFSSPGGGHNSYLSDSNARGLNAGYSGGNYPGIGYNLNHTTTGLQFTAPGTDSASYLMFENGGFNFYGAPTGAAGRTLNANTATLPRLMTVAQSGVVSMPRQSGVIARNTIAFSATGSGTVKVNFDTEVAGSDPQNEFTPGANHNFNATVPGDYLVCASLNATGLSTGFLFMYIYTAGALDSALGFNITGAFSASIVNGCAVAHTTAANTSIDVRITNAGGTANVGGTTVAGAGRLSISKLR